MQESNSRTQGAGRPRGAQAMAVRRKLLDAATRLFAVHGYRGVSTRAIAGCAGVNTAMVHYYFGNKEGLITAVVEEALQPVLDRAVDDRDMNDIESFIRGFLGVYMKTLADNPWLPGLLIREILLPEGRLKSVFVTRVASRVGSRLQDHIRRGKRNGEIAGHVDPLLATINLISLAAFPFLAMPVINEAFGFDVDERSIKRLRNHTTRLYLAAIRPVSPA